MHLKTMLKAKLLTWAHNKVQNGAKQVHRRAYFGVFKIRKLIFYNTANI